MFKISIYIFLIHNRIFKLFLINYYNYLQIIPIAIHCIAEEGSDEPKQSHTTIAVVEKHSDGTYVLKALKQKLYVDGLCYLLQEIYGIENKNAENAKV